MRGQADATRDATRRPRGDWRYSPKLTPRPRTNATPSPPVTRRGGLSFVRGEARAGAARLPRRDGGLLGGGRRELAPRRRGKSCRSAPASSRPRPGASSRESCADGTPDGGACPRQEATGSRTGLGSLERGARVGAYSEGMDRSRRLKSKGIEPGQGGGQVGQGPRGVMSVRGLSVRTNLNGFNYLDYLGQGGQV